MMRLVMRNESAADLDLLRLSPFVIAPGGKYVVGIAGLFLYAVCVVLNLTLLLVIFAERKLHQPMYFILLNQPLNDLLGSSAMVPKVLSDVLTEAETVRYPLCFLQGFLLHIYGCGTLLILAAMALDRYIAICNPLRYDRIMSAGTVIAAVASIWCVNLTLITSIFAFQATLPRCRTTLLNVFCDNQTLLRLSCADKTAINIYGLSVYVLLQSATIALQAFSYVRILHTCLTTKETGSRGKAINTCMAQLMIAFTFEFISAVNLTLYRLPDIPPDLRKANGILICAIPPLFNPIVYGLKIKEIRTALIKMISNKVSAQRMSKMV